VVTEQGRESMLGFELWCKRCDDGEPAPSVAGGRS